LILDIVTSSGTTWRIDREAKTWTRILENKEVQSSGKLAAWPNKITIGQPVSIIRESKLKVGGVDVFTTAEVLKILSVERDIPNVRNADGATPV
jgi:hypothetical protein